MSAGGTTRRLSGPPNTLGLYARVAATAIPFAGRLPFVAGGGGEMPELELELGDVAVDSGRLADYCRVCGFPPRDTLPATYPHVLAFPLQIALVTDGRFPFPAIGLVHIANTVTVHRPIGVGERLTVRVSPSALESHPRGQVFSVRTRVRAGSELVWEADSATLRRGGGGGSGEGGEETRLAELEQLPALGEWDLPEDLGRRYAGVSGDRNPIHIHALTAKPLGFPRAIVHGLWTKARCLAELDDRLPDAFSVSVRFRKPILLPASVEFVGSPGAPGEAIVFGVRDAERGTPHLEGSVTPSA